MKEFKKIIFAIVGFVVCFLVFDFGVGKFFDWAMTKMPSEGERVAKSDYVINKVEADFLVIGSSRAEAHYDSKVIQDAFPEYSVFNCGVDGQLFNYINSAFNCIMDRYSPKVVVWDFQLKDLVDDTPENLSLLYPYYYQNENVKKILDEQDATLKYIVWNSCYRYNGTAGRILRAMRMSERNKMGFLSHQSSDKSRKFKPEKVGWSDKIQLNQSRVEALESTLKRANEKGIKVVLCISPYLSKFTGVHPTIQELHRLSEKYSIQLVDMSQLDGFVGNTEYWYDGGHLDAEGAEVFTRGLVKVLRQYNAM